MIIVYWTQSHESVSQFSLAFLLPQWQYAWNTFVMEYYFLWKVTVSLTVNHFQESIFMMGSNFLWQETIPFYMKCFLLSSHKINSFREHVSFKTNFFWLWQRIIGFHRKWFPSTETWILDFFALFISQEICGFYMIICLRSMAVPPE